MDDKTMLRHQALNIAMARAPELASTDDVLAAADKVLAWLSADLKDAPEPKPVPQDPAQHESAASGI